MDNKLDESLLTKHKHQPLKIKVKYSKNVVYSIAKSIKDHLDNSNSSTFKRKPILVYTNTIKEAKVVFDQLKIMLKDDVTKIALATEVDDFKQTVIVIPDELNLC